jgi:hypothetical protein
MRTVAKIRPMKSPYMGDEKVALKGTDPPSPSVNCEWCQYNFVVHTNYI